MKRYLYALFVLLLAMAVAACGSDSDDAEASSGDDAATTTAAPEGDDVACPEVEGEKVVLSVSRPILAFAPILLAMQNGAFADAGLDVSIEPLSATEALAPLSQGRIDASLTSYSAGYFNAVKSGVELKWVMPAYSANPDSKEGYWVRVEDAGTEAEPTLDKLKGKTFGSPTAGTGAGGLVLANLLEEDGISLKDVTITQLAGADALLALENGAVSGAWLSDPIWVDATKNPDLRFFGSYPPGINGSGLVIGPNLISRPEVMTAFTKVVQETIAEHLGEGHLQDDEVVGHLATAIGTTPEALKAGLPLSYDPELSLEGGEEFLDELQQLMIDQGVLEYDEPYDTSVLIDETYAKEALSCS